MSYLMNNEQKMLDIIFAKRNKSYGAYAIRSAYGQTVFKSLFVMMMGFGSIISTAYWLSQRGNEPEAMGQPIIQDSVLVTEFKMPEDQPQKREETRTEPSHSKQESSTAIGTRIDTNAVESHSTELAVNTSSGTTGTDPLGPETPTTSGGGGGTLIADPVDTDTPMAIPDSAPEYDGGLPALYRFLASKLTYPTPAYYAGKQGTVYVRFVVDEYGKVGKLNLLNNQGFGMDEEALRVVGMIPKFKKPGMFGGKPVKVYYQLPIKFSMPK